MRQENTRQDWYKSWALWMSMAALIAYIIKSVWDKDITPWLSELADVLLPVLVGFGIINNPNISNAWVAPHTDNGDHAEDEEDDGDVDE